MPTPLYTTDGCRDTFAANPHFGLPGQTANDQTTGKISAVARSKLIALGCTRIRDNILNDDGSGSVGSKNQARLMEAWIDLGLKSTIILPKPTSASQAATHVGWIGNIASAVDFIEAPNEPKHTDHAFMETIWLPYVINARAAINASPIPRIRTLPFVGSAMAIGEATAGPYLRSIHGRDYDDIFDWYNQHPYTAKQAPEILTGNYSYPIRQANMAPAYPLTKPWMATESGNTTNVGTSNSVTEALAGAYAPRRWLSQLVQGCTQHGHYSLLDRAGVGITQPDPTNEQANFGLVRYDSTNKPAFTALANVMAILKKYAYNGAKVALSVTLTGQTSAIWTVLLQGPLVGYVIFAWWANLSTGDASATQGSPTILTLGSTFSKITQLNPGVSATTPVQTWLNTNTLSLNMPDRVQAFICETNVGPSPISGAVSKTLAGASLAALGVVGGGAPLPTITGVLNVTLAPATMRATQSSLAGIFTGFRYRRRYIFPPFHSVATPATQLVFTEQPGAAVSGQPITSGAKVQLRDAAGRNVAQEGVPVNWALGSGSGELLGVVTSYTNAAGAASLPPSFAVVPTSPPSSFTLQAVGGGFTATSAPFAVNAPGALVSGTLAKTLAPATLVASATTGALAAFGFRWISQPGPGVDNVPLPDSSIPYVHITDKNGGDFSDTRSVTFEVVEATGTVIGVAVVNAVAGVANPQPSSFGINAAPPGTFTLRVRATDNSLVPSISAPFDIVAAAGGVATQLVWTQQPIGGVSGQPLSTPGTVQVADASGTPVLTPNVSVAFSVQSGNVTFSGPTTALTNANGKATTPPTMIVTSPSPPATFVIHAQATV